MGALALELNNDSLTLEQKLALIDQVMADQVAEAKDRAVTLGVKYVPIDPMDALGCEGCQ